MAFSRIGSSSELAVLFSRTNFPSSLKTTKVESLHSTMPRRYPAAPRLPLPSNLSEVFNSGIPRFESSRERDILIRTNLYNEQSPSNYACSKVSKVSDSRLNIYDCSGSINLNSSMQTNVPYPYKSTTRSTYLNMPGGQWGRNNKYIAEDLRKTVYISPMNIKKGFFNGLITNNTSSRNYSTTNNAENKISGKEKITSSASTTLISARPTPAVWSKKERLKVIIKEYGTTVIVFHISISLVSLGIFYTLVSSGVDLKPLIDLFGPDESFHKVLSQSSTFIIAYTIHKLLAPVRLSITLAVTPILVKYLRRVGFIKRPKKPSVT